METNYDELLYREKFAILIARLHDLGFTDDIITQKIISHRYFNLFEENNHFAFINKSIEEIIAEVFNKQNVVINYNKSFTTEYYWAGLMYFNIMYHCHTPLERVFLIWPLSKMISKFNPYHEMPENALYDNYFYI